MNLLQELHFLLQLPLAKLTYESLVTLLIEGELLNVHNDLRQRHCQSLKPLHERELVREDVDAHSLVTLQCIGGLLHIELLEIHLPEVGVEVQVSLTVSLHGQIDE